MSSTSSVTATAITPSEKASIRLVPMRREFGGVRADPRLWTQRRRQVVRCRLEPGDRLRLGSAELLVD